MSRIAVVQRPPVFLDRSETMNRAVTAIAEAAQLLEYPKDYAPSSLSSCVGETR